MTNAPEGSPRWFASRLPPAALVELAAKWALRGDPIMCGELARKPDPRWDKAQLEALVCRAVHAAAVRRAKAWSGVALVFLAAFAHRILAGAHTPVGIAILVGDGCGIAWCLSRVAHAARFGTPAYMNDLARAYERYLRRASVAALYPPPGVDR